jgi:hypothetical protein
MQANPILIGTGFYANESTFDEKADFLFQWINNTENADFNIFIVDNCECSFRYSQDVVRTRYCRIKRNLGHASTPFHQVAKTPLLGWSISWIIPALIAYSEGCDFVYKEQDCLAFGDWLPIVCQGRATFGQNSIMPCEQSLFYLRHDFILTFIRDFMCVPGHDAQISTEDKFRKVMMNHGGDVKFHDLPGGRNRPVPDMTKPFYLQKITPEEMQALKTQGLI